MPNSGSQSSGQPGGGQSSQQFRWNDVRNRLAEEITQRFGTEERVREITDWVRSLDQTQIMAGAGSSGSSSGGSSGGSSGSSGGTR
jgi:hypothetical protein